MNDTTLTPTERLHVDAARAFVTGYDRGRDAGQDSYALGAAAEHIRRLLDVIAELTGGSDDQQVTS
jgi:hypothetical protein